MKIIKSNRIYLEDGCKSGYLFVEGNKIVDFKEELDSELEVVDYGDNRIIPGIIDTHTHGMLGYFLMRAEDETDEDVEYNIRGYLMAQASFGVTGVLPTAQPTIFANIAQLAKGTYQGAKILGIHSEGPYLSRVGEKGRPRPHPPVDLDFVKKMVKDADGMLKLVALAPEIEGIDVVMEYLNSENIKMAMAHSDLQYEGTLKAIEKGISVSTHLGNVMTGLHHRDIGGLGALVTSEQVDNEIVCDGFHLSLPFISLLFRIQDYSRFMMISDSIHLAGIQPGVYPGYLPNTQIHVDELGFIRDQDGRINGSSKAVLYGISNLVGKLNLPMETVIQMSSYNPARVYGFSDVKGSLQVGKDADFVIIDDQYQALATYVEGKKVFDLALGKMPFNPRYKFES